MGPDLWRCYDSDFTSQSCTESQAHTPRRIESDQPQLTLNRKEFEVMAAAEAAAAMEVEVGALPPKKSPLKLHSCPAPTSPAHPRYPHFLHGARIQNARSSYSLAQSSAVERWSGCGGVCAEESVSGIHVHLSVPASALRGTSRLRRAFTFDRQHSWLRCSL